MPLQDPSPGKLLRQLWVELALTLLREVEWLHVVLQGYY